MNTVWLAAGVDTTDPIQAFHVCPTVHRHRSSREPKYTDLYLSVHTHALSFAHEQEHVKT